MKVNLKDIEAAKQRLQGIVKKTAIEKSIFMSEQMGRGIWLKLENTQLTGSFKIRGAYNKISSLSDEQKARGIVASSAGNHAQGVALSAMKAKVQSTVVMPMNAPLIKVEATKAYGATVEFFGQVVDESHERARELKEKKGMTLIHPYEDELVIAGQGTIGLEILHDLPEVDTVIVPIGGGGLISGIATAIKSLKPSVRIIGVQSSSSNAMARLYQGVPDTTENSKAARSTIADGIAIKKPSLEIYESFIRPLVDEIVSVTDDEIAEAIVYLIEKNKTVTEGAGAAGFAALMNRQLQLGQNVCVLLCGGNIDLNLVAKVIEKGLIRKGRLCELSVIVEDLPGKLLEQTQIISATGANILQVHHDRISAGLYLRETRIDFVLETRNQEHIEHLKSQLAQSGARITISDTRSRPNS